MVNYKYVILNKSIYNALIVRLRIEYEIMLLEVIYMTERKKERESKDKKCLLPQKLLLYKL